MIGQHKGLYQSSGMTWMERELEKAAPKQQELFGKPVVYQSSGMTHAERKNALKKQERFGTPTEDKTWCYWCDRERLDCACHLDPNGIPDGHWSRS